MSASLPGEGTGGSDLPPASTASFWFGFPASVAPILSGSEGVRHSVQQGWRFRSETSPHAWGACSPPPQAPPLPLPTPRPHTRPRPAQSQGPASSSVNRQRRSQPGSLQWGSGPPYLPSALDLYVHLFSNSLGRCSSWAVCPLAGVRAACQTPALSKPTRSPPRSRTSDGRMRTGERPRTLPQLCELH